MNIAFIGFGEAARAFIESLDDGTHAFAAYDLLLGTDADRPMRDAAERHKVRLAPDAPAAVAGAEWVVSAVTASASLDAARSVASALAPGQLFIDINSVSAARKRETEALLAPSGATYLDMAVMAPVHPRGHRTPVLVAGQGADGATKNLRRLGFDFEIVGPETGAATAIKMVRSLFVKGMEAVTVQALLAARAAGCLDRVYSSLAASFERFGWPEFGEYQLERVTRHGVRRAAEMRESAASQRELGFDAGFALADAIADVQDEIGVLGLRIAPETGIEAALDAILERRAAGRE